MFEYSCKKKSGYTDTKNYPHKNHLAKYNRLGNDDVEYVTFTHHDKVKIKDKIFKTIPLNSNIDKKQKNTQPNNKFSWVNLWRRTQDSNLRRLSPQRFSRPPL